MRTTDANLGDALIDGKDPEDLLIETDFGVHLLRRATSSRTSRRG